MAFYSTYWKGTLGSSMGHIAQPKLEDHTARAVLRVIGPRMDYSRAIFYIVFGKYRIQQTV